MLSQSKKAVFRSIIDHLQTLTFRAADPHVDCRDEMQDIAERIDDLVDELFEPDDQEEADDCVSLFPEEEKGGGA